MLDLWFRTMDSMNSEEHSEVFVDVNDQRPSVFGLTSFCFAVVMLSLNCGKRNLKHLAMLSLTGNRVCYWKFRMTVVRFLTLTGGSGLSLTGIRSVRVFVSLCSYYRKYIWRFAEISAPLTDLLKDGQWRSSSVPDVFVAVWL